MNIIGPDWPCTRLLKEALKDFDSPDFRWGLGGKNGLEQLKDFQFHGLRTPKFTSDLETAKLWVRSGLKVFGRNLNHTQGKDIVDAKYTPRTPDRTPDLPPSSELRWITTRKENRVQRLRSTPGRSGGESWNPKWLRKDFWVQVIEVKNEYRQHIFGEKAIRRGKKIQVSPQISNLPVRSRRNGWHLDYGQFEAPSGLRDLGKAAVKALGYTHGACDIVEDLEGELWILEVNSAPSLGDENTLKAYVDAIKARQST